VQQRQEFVIGGWTDPKGSRTGLGSLLLGVHDDEGGLRYAGNVGTGFDDAHRCARCAAKLEALAVTQGPWSSTRPSQREGRTGCGPAHRRGGVHRVDRARAHVRHPVFHGLRSDKPPRAIVARTARSGREEAAGAQARPKGAPPRSCLAIPSASSIRRQRHTKLDLVRYYARVGAADAAAPAGPAGRAGARAARHRRRAVLPEAPRADRPIRGHRRRSTATRPGARPMLEVGDEAEAGLLSPRR
jgi:bifunctional non-homologous end joining protein LigD